jgi:hypothetical protein
MNLIRCLVEALNPCVHQYRTVATMYDNPDKPTITTLVQECDICGDTRRMVFDAEGVCQHHWQTLQRISVFPTTDKPDPDAIPLYYRFVQQCTKCGVLQKSDMK